MNHSLTHSVVGGSTSSPSRSANQNPLLWFAESRYNPKISVVENIQLPPTLLSRFDLIYLVLDNANAESDRRLAQHLVSLYFKEPPAPRTRVDTDLLREAKPGGGTDRSHRNDAMSNC